MFDITKLAATETSIVELVGGDERQHVGVHVHAAGQRVQQVRLVGQRRRGEADGQAPA